MVISTLDTLSRLKGIETYLRARHPSTSHTALDTLSRLKGIETVVGFDLGFGLELWIHFPV